LLSAENYCHLELGLGFYVCLILCLFICLFVFQNYIFSGNANTSMYLLEWILFLSEEYWNSATLSLLLLKTKCFLEDRNIIASFKWSWKFEFSRLGCSQTDRWLCSHAELDNVSYIWTQAWWGNPI